MKIYSLTLLLLIVLTATAIAQKPEDEEKSVKRKDVPEAVLAVFRKSYPNASIKGYAKEKDDGNVVYEIESKEGKILRDVLYDPDGTVIVVEESLPYSKMPQPIRDVVSKNYPNGKVTRSEKLTRGSSTQYEVAMRMGNQEVEVIFEPIGTEAKKEVK